MANKRRKSNKPKCTALFKCKPRSLDQLSRWEFLRFESALNAAANLSEKTQRPASSSNFCCKSKSSYLQSGEQSLIEDPFACRCLAVTLMILNFLHGSHSKSEMEKS